MVRDAIARTTARGSTSSPRAGETGSPRAGGDPLILSLSKDEPNPARDFAAFALLPLPRGGDTDGACLIEPAVRCNHCGYCLSYGH